MTALPARRLSPSPLLSALAEQLKLRHYSERTSRAYTGWVLRYIRFHGKRHPNELGREHVVEFLSALAIRSNVSASTQNQALAVISFLYRELLQIPLEDVDQVPRAKRPVRLPVVLTRDEVRQLINELEGTPRLVAMLLYGCGLRILECVQLRVKRCRFRGTPGSGEGWQGR